MTKVNVFDFGELRSLLQQEPSARVWEQLCEQVTGVRWERTAERWLPYAMDILDRGWPDHLRKLQNKWITRKKVTAAKLCRAVDIGYPNPRQLEQLVTLVETHGLRLTALSMSGIDWESEGQLKRFLAHTELESLHVPFWLGELLAKQLKRKGVVERLRVLRLGTTGMSSEAVLGVVGSGHLKALRELELRDNRDRELGLGAALMASRLDERLESLTLRSMQLSAADLDALAARAWPMLHTLDLERALAEQANEALGRLLRGAPGLKRLNLTPGWVDDALVRVVATLAGVELESLDVSEAAVSAEALVELLASPVCAKLKVLGADKLSMSGEVGAAIAGSTMAQTLEVLRLDWGRVEDEFWEELARVELPRLRSLSLTGTRITLRGERALLSLKAPELGDVAYE
jgi:hypothetical protein